MESSSNATEYTSFERIVSLTVALFLLMISLVTTVTNTLLLSAIYFDPFKCFRKVPIVFITNLALADLLTGVIVSPLYAAYDFGVFRNVHYTRTLMVGDYISYNTVNNANVTILILIIDRNVAIKMPFMYRRAMSLKTASVIVAISWIYAGFFSTFRVMGMSDKAYILLNTHLHFTFAFVSLTCLFGFIYSNLKTERRGNLRKVTSMDNIDGAKKEQLQKIKSDKRFLVTVFLILFIFFITYSPYAVFIHLKFYCAKCQGNRVYFFLSTISEPFVYLNSALNPFMYAWRHKNFRMALLWVLKYRTKKKRTKAGENATTPDKQGRS